MQDLQHYWNTALAVGRSKTTRNLELSGQEPSGCKLSLAISPPLNTRALTSDLIYVLLVSFHFLKIHKNCFYKHFYLYLIWISTNPCITPPKGINGCI
jgi:hypothetical protein